MTAQAMTDGMRRHIAAAAKELARLGGYAATASGVAFDTRQAVVGLAGEGEVLARAALRRCGMTPAAASRAADRAARGGALADRMGSAAIAERLYRTAGVLRFVAAIAASAHNSANAVPPHWLVANECR